MTMNRLLQMVQSVLQKTPQRRLLELGEKAKKEKETPFDKKSDTDAYRKRLGAIETICREISKLDLEIGAATIVKKMKEIREQYTQLFYEIIDRPCPLSPPNDLLRTLQAFLLEKIEKPILSWGDAQEAVLENKKIDLIKKLLIQSILEKHFERQTEDLLEQVNSMSRDAISLIQYDRAFLYLLIELNTDKDLPFFEEKSGHPISSKGKKLEGQLIVALTKINKQATEASPDLRLPALKKQLKSALRALRKEKWYYSDELYSILPSVCEGSVSKKQEITGQDIRNSKTNFYVCEAAKRGSNLAYDYKELTDVRRGEEVDRWELPKPKGFSDFGEIRFCYRDNDKRLRGVVLQYSPGDARQWVLLMGDLPEDKLTEREFALFVSDAYVKEPSESFTMKFNIGHQGIAQALDFTELASKLGIDFDSGHLIIDKINQFKSSHLYTGKAIAAVIFPNNEESEIISVRGGQPSSSPKPLWDALSYLFPAIEWMKANKGKAVLVVLGALLILLGAFVFSGGTAVPILIGVGAGLLATGFAKFIFETAKQCCSSQDSAPGPDIDDGNASIAQQPSPDPSILLPPPAAGALTPNPPPASPPVTTGGVKAPAPNLPSSPASPPVTAGIVKAPALSFFSPPASPPVTAVVAGAPAPNLFSSPSSPVTPAPRRNQNNPFLNLAESTDSPTP